MAIDEFNAKGGVLGRKIEWITADTETTPATGSRVAERFITREDCTILIGALHSGVANAITQVANKYGTIYLNTNSSAPSEAGENCSRVKFVWDGNGTNFSKAAVKNAVDSIGKNWLLLTNDYVWGHTTSAATKTQVEAAGGKIVDNLLVPQNTRDFTAYLLKIQQAKPDVVATAIGGDDIKALREQVAQLKLDGKPAWINNQQDWPDMWGAPESLFGVFGTTWYHKLPLPGVAEFVKKWQAANKDGPIPVPGNVSYNGYMATRELLRAIERAGSTNNIKIIKELENLKISATDRMQHFDAYMDPVTHQMQQTIYLARAQHQAVRQHRPLRDHQLDRAEGRCGHAMRRPSASSCPTSRCRPSTPERRQADMTLRSGRAQRPLFLRHEYETAICSTSCRISSTA